MLQIAEAEKVQPTPRKLLLGGKEVGSATVDEHGRWRVIVSIEDRRFTGGVLIFGYGTSLEEAFGSAVVDGRAKRDAMIERMEELEARVSADAMAPA